MLRKACLALLLLWTWVVCVYHLGVFIPPPHPNINPAHASVWIPKEKLGIHQLILTGSPYERGLASGKFEGAILYRQEKSLVDRLFEIFPNPVVFKTLQVAMIRWFWGGDTYFEPWTREEMAGVAQSAPHDFDYLGDGYTRQLYYHGLHEVGQMMVDQTSDDMGCTIAAYPHQNRWVIGRNFDFEGGRIFDTEKVMKWVFPDQGYAFVSVIWAGMVGAVTGVNEHGLFIALNAAGSRDFRRYGTPTTLVVLKALQFARTADEAVEIIRNADTFITDIFVVSDATSGKLYRVEKAPHHTEVVPLPGPALVGNHLISDYWKDDAINRFRRDDLTSRARTQRGEVLLAKLQSDHPGTAREIQARVLAILRDKGEAGGQPLALGNRSAIDSLIATHAVVYDEPTRQLFVSQGPSLAGAFTGFDLTESFRRHTPVTVPGFDRDPLVSDTLYAEVKQANVELNSATRLLKKGKCAEAAPYLAAAHAHFAESYTYSTAWGNYRECLGDHAGAQMAWREAQARSPAYASERLYLEKKVGPLK